MSYTLSMRYVFEQKIKRLDKLTKGQQEELLSDLLIAFQVIRDPTDVAHFVQDLFTKSEIIHLSKRLRIAKLLLVGTSYEDIEKDLHTSHGTVAKVAAWLAEKGEGFRRVLAKLPKDKSPGAPAPSIVETWNNLKRQYPRYFWPEILLEEVVKLANARQKDTLRRVLATLEEKNDMHRHLESLLSAQYKIKKKYSTT